MSRTITVAAGKQVQVDIVGRFFRCREASNAFNLKVGSDTYTLEGGDEFTVRDTDDDFKRLVFVNLSSTEELTVEFFAGKNIVRSAYVKLPRTRIVGHDINLANTAELAFPGIDEFGKRRKQFTVTLKPGTASTDRLLVYDDDADKLLAIVSPVSSGGGFAIETDSNLRIVNRTGSAVESTSSDPDIAVAETFYR